jgi:hypothetical protein
VDVANRKRWLACASAVLGAELFNRLVASVAETRTKGRLRFWQEALLARLSAESEITLVTMEEFLAVFEGAELQPIPKKVLRAFTKYEFLSNPVAVYLDPSVPGIPAEWFQEAWDVEEVEPEKSLRQYITGDVWHEANKGSLPLVAGQLRSLACILRHDQWVQLYKDVRADEPHREEEIRREFAGAAPGSALSLPPPLTRQEVVAALAAFGFDEATAAELMGEQPPEDG